MERALDDQLARFEVTDPGHILMLKLYAYATIPVENTSFRPMDEQPSRYAAFRRAPRPEGLSENVRDIDSVTQMLIDEYHFDARFALYDDDLRMKPQAALGNTERGMGARFKGRGFIQLTGRSNYLAYAARASAPRIVDKPVEGGTP